MHAKVASPPESGRHAPDPGLEQAPLPVATVAGASHVLVYVNAAFCRLTDRTEADLLGKPFRDVMGERTQCIELLTRVYRSGKTASHMERDHLAAKPVLWSYTMWPVDSDEPAIGIIIQAIETTPLYERTLQMNEALVIGSLRQHELTAAATMSNTQLRTEADDHRQRALDAKMLTNEISHRIKNNLQIIVGLIGYESRRAAAPCVQAFDAMQTRIVAIASLYDLMSQSSHGKTVALDEYLREIARALSETLLETASSIEIAVNAEPVDIDPERAVPLGLLVNELVTNAIKHAFPGGTGSVVLSVRQIGDQVELEVADNGSGVKDKQSAKTSEQQHGADYVAIFVRQLGGTRSLVEPVDTGTIVRIRFPLTMVHGR